MTSAMDTSLPDLAVRTFGGSVVWANDELFAGRENLIAPGPLREDPWACFPA